ncbi:MAG: ATP-binding protein [Bacteroidales bacterium]|nr:ATP-binding protein [Bacteroidales bacterium]
MISKYLYVSIIIRVLLLVVFCSLLGYFILVDYSVRIAIICLIAIIVLTLNLISFLNTTNKKIRFFFDSVRNDDSSLSFPGDIKGLAFSELYESMNRVNRQIQKLKIENRQQEQYFQTLLEHLATGIITYDSRGHVMHANSAAKRLLSAEVLTHLSQIERIDKKLFNTINNIKPFERKLVALNNERGETQLSLKATSFGMKENELIILSVQDIKHELDEKELESWMKLIRVLMHEIMNSITPITSLSESLSKIYTKNGDPVPPEEVTSKAIDTTLQGLNVIKDQGKGLMSFVESYRKLTKVPEPEKKIFRVTDLLSRVKILYESLETSRKVELSVKVINPDLEIFADQNLISQVLINLLKNALEANENNPDTRITIIANTDIDNRPELCVIDNGPGISEAKLDEIFVPFFTTKEKGSGIGLSISRQIMKVHGGNLKVRSVPDKETVFCLSF